MNLADTHDFTDIRAYPERLFRKYWRQLQTDPYFIQIMDNLNKNQKWLSGHLSHLRTWTQYRNMIYQLVNYLIHKTMDDFSWSGSEILRSLVKTPRKSSGAIFVSSHRSTSLDPILFNFLFYEEAGLTAYNAVGDNLLTPSWLGHLIRLNGGFIVKRKINDEDIDTKLEEAEHLSQYIANLLSRGKHVWIAQRNGRAKDGNDKTDSAVLAMIKLAHRDKNWEEFCNTIPIIPVSVSYEEIPLDATISQDHLGELDKSDSHLDSKQVIKELTQKKKRIHIHISERIQAKKRSALARNLDKKIIQGTKIWDSNRAAYDLLTKNTVNSIQKIPWFQERLDAQTPQLRQALINLYAAPLVNLHALSENTTPAPAWGRNINPA
ncbi:MAG: 1-acyl-sn-glycerol-3-phosphate acyltransferase [Salinispira sp.]